MLTYWKITFTIALVAVLVGAANSAITVKTPIDNKGMKIIRLKRALLVTRDLLLLAFMSFVCIGLAIEVWA